MHELDTPTDQSEHTNLVTQHGNFVCDGGDGFVCMHGKKDKREGGGERNGCSAHCVRKMRKKGEDKCVQWRECMKDERRGRRERTNVCSGESA